MCSTADPYPWNLEPDPDLSFDEKFENLMLKKYLKFFLNKKTTFFFLRFYDGMSSCTPLQRDNQHFINIKESFFVNLFCLTGSYTDLHFHCESGSETLLDIALTRARINDAPTLGRNGKARRCNQFIAFTNIKILN